MNKATQRFNAVVGSTDMRCLIVMSQLPESPTRALILNTEPLSVFITSLIDRALRQPEAETVDELYELFDIIKHGDSNILNSLHHNGLLSAVSMRENKNIPIDIDIGSVFIRIGTDRYDGRVSVEDISCATPDELAIKIASKFLGNTVETYTMSVGIQNLIIASLTNGGVLEYYDIGTGERINYEYVEFVISRK